ncbi:MAG: hypothetical protein ACYTJ0_03180 [Planctomycetota bacterium]|jgi:hypothetical protein
MVLTRPRRKALFGVILGVLLAAVIFAVLWRRSDITYAQYLSGFPVSQQGERSFYTFGATRWLVVERRVSSAPGVTPRTHELQPRINAAGLLEALVTIAIAGLALHWAWQILVARLARDGYCDWCGYDLTGLTAGRCPECGHAFGAEAPAEPPGITGT